jgi:hypothetical protein
MVERKICHEWPFAEKTDHFYSVEIIDIEKNVVRMVLIKECSSPWEADTMLEKWGKLCYEDKNLFL